MEDSSYPYPLEQGEQLKEWVDQIFCPFCLEFEPVLPDVLIWVSQNENFLISFCAA